MAQPYIGEIRVFAGNYAPAGWAFCNGQLMAISENNALFTLIGTTYGGDGQTTFALPDLRSRVPIHQGTGSDGTTHLLGESAGVEEVTLNANQIPAHSHPLLGSLSIANDLNPAGKLLGESRPGDNNFFQDVPLVQMAPLSISSVGGSQPHTNFQPYLCLNFIIALFGIFPTQS